MDTYLNGNYKIFNEFLNVFQKKEYFGLEKKLLKIFQTTNEWSLFEKVLTNFRNIFDNSNSAKYTSRDTWFQIFGENLYKEFSKYCYISWEKIILDLQEEKPLDFPCLNDILRKVEKIENALPIKEIKFLKTLGIL